MSWNNDLVLEFIELYKKEQVLWDPRHPAHRNRSEVSDAWARIQLSLGVNCSITDLKKKKESIMTSFRMHLNKKKSIEGYQTSWFAFPLMASFLGEKYHCDSTMENEVGLLKLLRCLFDPIVIKFNFFNFWMLAQIIGKCYAKGMSATSFDW